MAKRINMTRERQVALPTILSAANGMLTMLERGSKQRVELERALEAFK